MFINDIPDIEISWGISALSTEPSQFKMMLIKFRMIKTDCPTEDVCETCTFILSQGACCHKVLVVTIPNLAHYFHLHVNRQFNTANCQFAHFIMCCSISQHEMEHTNSQHDC